MKILMFALLALLINPSVLAKKHDYKIGKEAFEGFVIKNGKRAPLVIIIHDWDGLDDYEVKRARMLSKQGYSVFALDMFGKGVRPQVVKEKKKQTGALYKDRKRMRMLMDGALKEAKTLGLNVNNASVVGYCFGGTSALEWAKSGANLKGFASFHGDMSVKKGDTYTKSKGKINVYHGTADKIVSMQSFADFAVLLEKEKIDHEMITYSGAPHAFTKFGSDRYREEADNKSWKNYSAFLKDVH